MQPSGRFFAAVQSGRGNSKIMGLEMRARCERCGKELSPASVAFICSHECTYCEDCALILRFMCTNCEGELVRRPKRRAEAANSECGPSDE